MEASFARSILVNAPMAVVAIDAAGCIRTSNATADAFFGRALTCEPPLRISDFIADLVAPPPTSADDIAAFNARSRSAGDGVYLRAQAASGAETFVDVQAAPFSVRGEDFLTLFISDVTEIVAAQAVVQDLRHQITNNWRLNSLGEVASMAAHEINQPLSAVINFLDAAKSLAARSPPDVGKIIRYINSAEQQAERAGAVIRRLRAVMSKDTGFQAPERVAEVVAEIMPILLLNARERDAEIVVNLAPDQMARCDRVQLQQLVLNLVRNALDAPGTGHKRRIRISGAPTDCGCRVTIEDNGPGITPDMNDRLFVPLATTKVGGMGLGLSICRTIVEAHGGEIALVPSSLGGAAFAFTLVDAQTHV